MRAIQTAVCRFLLTLALVLPGAAPAEQPTRSIGIYYGQYYHSEPAGFSQGRANYLNHYMVAVTGSIELSRHSQWPLALELDGMIGQQWGLADVTEIALAPVLRWDGFPWSDHLRTALRVGPLGFSYTSIISPLERGPTGEGSRTLNFFLFELAFALPQYREHELFLRLHHRCTIYDLLNNYGANGEDFFTLGYRRYF